MHPLWLFWSICSAGWLYLSLEGMIQAIDGNAGSTGAIILAGIIIIILPIIISYFSLKLILRNLGK